MTYFTNEELQCPCCKQVVLAPGFLDDLNHLRESFGFPMALTSCCRCADHNAKVAGKEKSFHLINCKSLTGIDGACAADISWASWDGNKRWRFVKVAMGLGFSVGIDKSFVHVDRRTRYRETGWPNPVMWGY